MADITLAEFDGRVWMVGGEPYLDDLLFNSLDRNISIEIIPCETKSQVQEMWLQMCGPQAVSGDPWLIHPAIVARIRRGSSDYSVLFTEWSAMLDSQAHGEIAAVVTWAAANPGASFELVEFLVPGAPKGMADLSRLRAQLVEDKLVELGVTASLISRAQRDLPDADGKTADSRRIDIVVKPAD